MANRSARVHLTRNDIVPFLVLLLRVRDGGPTTPGGLIRRLIEVTARARKYRPSQCLWVYCGAGAFAAGIGHPQELVDSWTRRHDIIDDDGRPLRLLLSRLRKTHKALWYLKTEGHMARFAVGHTPEVAARHYADVPALRSLHEATVADAFREAVNSARAPIVLTAEQEAAWRNGEQDVWLAGCAGFYASPHGSAGDPCPIPFWGCLECSNAVITTRKLPAILSFLDFIEDQRRALHAGDWAVKFGRAHVALETGLEIECCKELMVDCLQNASNGTIEITYLKRRARGAEHKRTGPTQVSAIPQGCDPIALLDGASAARFRS